jgi:subtilase family serine protease
MLHGHVPGVVAHLQPVGRLPASQRLNLAIGIPLRNEAALDVFLQELYDPASPNYHQYLTPEQFTEKFGPTESDYEKVIAFARANGLTVTATHGNRVLLDVSGSVTDIERAFQTSINIRRRSGHFIRRMLSRRWIWTCQWRTSAAWTITNCRIRKM